MKLLSLKNSKKGLIIHHWDTDGLCSAALFLSYLQKLNPQLNLKYRPPIINNYYLTDLELTQIKKEEFDFILAVDINFSEKTIQGLQKITNNFYWFDHHHQTERIEAKGVQNEKYLSCAYLISDYLRVKDFLLAVYGMVGDKEESVKDNFLVKEIQRKYSLNFADLMQIKDLIDANYVLDDYQGIKRTVRTLSTDPLQILQDKRLQQDINKIRRETEKAIVQDPEINKDILNYTLESPYNILSLVTRVLSKKYPNKIVVNFHTKGAKTNFYVRTARKDIDLRKLLKEIKKKGYHQAGGKKEVLGVELETKKLKNFKSEINKWLIKNYLS